MTDTPRLIEHAFLLKQTSLDSVHEKNVRHGHISTLHIWPARRPLAACRAALIATLLPDPSAQPKPNGMSDEDWHQEIIRLRRDLCEKIGGKVVKTIEKKMPSGQTVEQEREVTEGGILHWGRETENKEILEWFRQEIRLTAHANEFLTNGEGCVYVSTVKPPGSFGERVRSRSERGGSCFLRWGES